MFFSSSNRLSLTLPLIIALFLPAVALADSTSQPAQVSIIKSTNIPSPPSADRMGSSGGMLSDHLLLLGGSHDGGVIINESLILPPNGTEWKHLPLQEGRAWAASAVHQNTLILAGGLLANGPTSKVTRVSLDGQKLVFTELPPLPKPLAGAGAAIAGEKLYVVGGITSANDQQASSEMLSLDLAHPDQGWKQLAPLPAGGKVLPMVTGQYDMIEVIGGRETTNGTNFIPSKEVWIYRYKPSEGTTSTGWSRSADLPTALAGATAIPSGQAHILVVGGDSFPVKGTPFAFSEAPNSPTLLFHIVTDAWIPAGQPLSLHGSAYGRDTAGNLIIFGGQGLHDPLQVSIPRTARNLNWVDYLMIVIYFSFIGYIGYYFRKQKSAEEFSLGNRETVWWAAGISMFATAASAISFMAVPALAFASNLVWLFPLVVFVPVYFFNTRITYPILRRLEITSTFEYLERRFNTELRLIASFIQILFQTFGRDLEPYQVPCPQHCDKQ